MFNLLLTIIYLTFISLGLPDAVLGTSWPIMYKEFNVPLSNAGIVSMIICFGTIVSSLNTNKLLKKFGTGLLTSISVLLTAFALLGFSFSSSFIMLCIMAIPYGLGAGAVDASINNYVALHYSAKHMNWLHSFWGLGATLGPIIMGVALSNNYTWNLGYIVLFILQLIISIFLFSTLSLWKDEKNSTSEEDNNKTYTFKELISLKGSKSILIAFFCYCSLEVCIGLWSSSFLVLQKNFLPSLSATLTSLFFLGITFGRFFSGFLSNNIKSSNLIRLGETFILLGLILLVSSSNHVIIGFGLVLMGIGCAPVYPSIIHETPNKFGKNASSSMIGLQMASAYVGSTFTPPIIGFITDSIGIVFLPVLLLIILITMAILIELSNYSTR